MASEAGAAESISGGVIVNIMKRSRENKTTCLDHTNHRRWIAYQHECDIDDMTGLVIHVAVSNIFDVFIAKDLPSFILRVNVSCVQEKNEAREQIQVMPN